MKDSGRNKWLVPKSGTAFQSKANSQDDQPEALDKVRKKKENKKKGHRGRQKRQERQDNSLAATSINTTQVVESQKKK